MAVAGRIRKCLAETIGLFSGASRFLHFVRLIVVGLTVHAVPLLARTLHVQLMLLLDVCAFMACWGQFASAFEVKGKSKRNFAEVYKESRKSLKVDSFFKRPLTVGRLVYDGGALPDTRKMARFIVFQ
jgi:hypothetical protein